MLPTYLINDASYNPLSEEHQIVRHQNTRPIGDVFVKYFNIISFYKLLLLVPLTVGRCGVGVEVQVTCCPTCVVW